MNFEELRSFICESDRGRVFDSLVAVEIGIDHYECAWQAHCDMNPHEETDEIIAAFLLDMADYVGVADEDFDKVLANAE